MGDSIQNVKIKIIGDADFSKANQELKGLSASEQQLINQTKQLDTETQKTGQSIQDNASKSQKATQDTSKSFEGLTGKVKDLASNIPGAFQVQQVLSFGKEIGNAGKSVQGLSGMFNILKISIAATGIGLLVIAVASLVAYFTQTEAGGDKLARVMGGLKSVFQGVLNVLISVGSYVAGLVEQMFSGFSKVYDFLVKQFLTALKGLSIVLESIGFDGAASAVDQFAESVDKANASMKDMYDNGVKLADMEDALEDKTTKLALANAKLTTEIDQNLKALRNRTITYQEQLALIQKVDAASTQQLKNNQELITDQIAIEKQRFINQADDQASAAKNFDDYVAGRIAGDQLIAKVDGQNTRDTVDNISQVLIKQEEATREFLVLNERIDNMRDQFAEKEKARIEAIQKKKLDEINIEAGFDVRRAQLADQSASDILLIEIKAQDDRLALLKKYNKQNSDDYENTLLKKEELEKKYSDVILNEQKKLNADVQAALSASLKIQQDVITQYSLLNQKNISAESLQKQQALQQEYLKGNISFQQFQDMNKSIQQDTQRDMLNNEIDAIQKRIDIDKSYGISTVALEKELVDKQKALLDIDVQNYQAAEAKKTAAKQQQTQKRMQMEQQAQQLATQVIQGISQIQQQEYNNQLTTLENNKAQELAAVGDNAQAQAVINAKYAKEEAQVKTKQAQAEKETAEFNIVLSTAAAVAKASPVVPLMLFAAAQGALQLGLVAAKPIPKYNKGTKSLPGRDTGDDSVLIMARPGEGIMPVDRMKDYQPAFDAIFDRKVPANFINSIALNYDKIAPVQHNNSGAPDRLSEKILNKLDNLKILNVNMDRKGFEVFMTESKGKSVLENNYLNV